MSLVAVLMDSLPPRKKRHRLALHGGTRGRLLPSVNPTTVWLHRGMAAQDYRQSYANVWRRLERGETPQVCPECGCEVDVERPAHDPRCSA